MTTFVKDHAKVKNLISELNYNTYKYFQGIRYLEAKECRLAAFDLQRVFTVKSEAPTVEVLKDRCASDRLEQLKRANCSINS